MGDLEKIINKDMSYYDGSYEVGSFDEYGLGLIYEDNDIKKKTDDLLPAERDLIGFYKIATHTESYKVQLAPALSFYDYFKTKRAFLFC